MYRDLEYLLCYLPSLYESVAVSLYQSNTLLLLPHLLGFIYLPIFQLYISCLSFKETFFQLIWQASLNLLT